MAKFRFQDLRIWQLAIRISVTLCAITLVQDRFFTTGAQRAQRANCFIWQGGTRQIKSTLSFQNMDFMLSQTS